MLLIGYDGGIPATGNVIAEYVRELFDAVRGGRAEPCYSAAISNVAPV